METIDRDEGASRVRQVARRVRGIAALLAGHGRQTWAERSDGATHGTTAGLEAWVRRLSALGETVGIRSGVGRLRDPTTRRPDIASEGQGRHQ